MARWIVILLMLAAAGGGVWFWMAREKPSEMAAGGALDIYFTCDTSGRIEPCGCFTGQMGGLTRVSTALRSAPAGALKMEVGDAIAGTEDYHVMQYGHLLRAYSQAGYHAVNLGRREAKLPAATLRQVAAASPVPLVSANVVDTASRQPVVKPWLVVKQGALRVAVTGLVDPARLQGVPGAGVEVAGMAESLRALLPAMKAESEVIVCLAFTDEEGLDNLAREFYEVPVFLGGDVRQPSNGVAKVNRSLVFATTNQGRALAELHATYDPAKAVLTPISGHVRLMEPRISQDKEIAARSADYRRQVRDAVLSLDKDGANAADRVPGVKAPASYVGSETCAGCHPKAFATWSESKHAHAFASLVEKDSDADPSCISCHVTGFGEPGGYRRSMQGKQMVNVGCESCHGPASAHVAERGRAALGTPALLKMRAVGAGQCVQCHHGEFSRPFQFEEFWPLVSHGKETP